MQRWKRAGWCFLLLGMASPGFSQETPANLVRLGAGATFPGNGSGWVTDHLQTTWMATAGYDRFLTPHWALEAGGSWQRNPVDTSDSPISDLDLFSDTWGLHAGVRSDLLTKKTFHLYADLGIGFYQSLLYVNGAQEDSAAGWGVPLGLGGEFFLPARLSLGLRLGYLPLFMSQGASFDSLQVQLQVGTFWGKTQFQTPRKPKREPMVKQPR